MGRKKKFGVIIIAAAVFFNFYLKAFCLEDADLYKKGVQAAKNGDRDSAFLSFHGVLNYPGSKFYADALFAAGEYYFGVSALDEASMSFVKLLELFPGSPAKPFALAYLANISEKAGRGELVEYFQKQIIASKQFGLVFKGFKEYRYVSGFSKEYRIRYYIDAIEIYIDDESFIKFQL